VKVFRTEMFEDTACDEIVSLLRSGGIIAFPTDTAYGLGADPFNNAAVDRIFQIKGRSETKPILLLVSSVAMAESVTEPASVFHELAQQFWPGPLTVILPAAKSVPLKVTAGTETVGVRWPVADFATRLVKRFGQPITATSANQSGLPSAITAEEVRLQLDDSIDALIDGGPLPSRVGSTLIDLTVDPPLLLREGPISFETLRRFFEGRIRRRP
jgi:L-threonylcarbamoyladenylate synthase